MNGEDKLDKVDSAQRDQTDKSLRVERDKADASVAKSRDAVEERADEVVRVARELADEVVQDARDAADHTQPAVSPATEALVDRRRAQADELLENERSEEDSALHATRAERSRYLVDFLAAERQATDDDLIRERDCADRLVSTRDEFLATVSHDIRSLLNGLGLNAELVLKQAPAGPDGDWMRRHAATTQRTVARMNRLVNDLLDVASIEAGKLSVFPEQVDLSKLLRDTLDAFEPIALAKGVTLDIEAAPVPPHAHLDGARILQVLANLVSNAIKFTPRGGRVSVRVRADKGSIEFAVTDTGMGVPETELSRIFERFRQVSKDRRGLGLGLHISKSIVEVHGGTMWAESKVGSGSTFYFSLGVSAAEAPRVPRCPDLGQGHE